MTDDLGNTLQPRRRPLDRVAQFNQRLLNSTGYGPARTNQRNTGGGNADNYSRWEGDIQLPTRGGMPSTGMRATDEAIAASQKANPTVRGRFRQPIEAGTINGNRVQIVGPQLVRTYSPNGGYSVISVKDAHNFVSTHPGFVAHPEYRGDPRLADAREKGFGKVEPAPTVEQSPSGPVLSRSGVATPVENLSQADRMQFNAYPQGFAGLGQRAIDTLTASPAAKAVGRFAGNAIDAVTGFMRGEPPMPVPPSIMGDKPVAMATPPAASPTPTPQLAGGGAVPAGASNRQAARVETPTAASPVPKTETSPAPNVNTTQLSTSPTPAPQAEAPVPAFDPRRRYAYQGFNP